MVGLFPANRVGDDIEIYRDETRTHVINVSHHLRQQTEKPAFANYCLADFVAPKVSGKADYIGAFAVTGGLEEDALADAFEAQADDLTKSWWQRADRLAEACGSISMSVRKVYLGYAPNENLSNEELIRETTRASVLHAGYPPCSGNIREKATIWASCWKWKKHTGMKLTESFAMWPGASVSVGTSVIQTASITRWRKFPSAIRLKTMPAVKGMSVTEVERWLAPNLGYDAE